MSYLYKFWLGKITLWKSYLIIGELVNTFVIFLIINLEIKHFDNLGLLKQIPFIDFKNISFLSKIILISWNGFITVGIWRSAENYKGKFIWIVLALIMLSYRIFTLRLILY